MAFFPPAASVTHISAAQAEQASAAIAAEAQRRVAATHSLAQQNFHATQNFVGATIGEAERGNQLRHAQFQDLVHHTASVEAQRAATLAQQIQATNAANLARVQAAQAAAEQDFNARWAAANQQSQHIVNSNLARAQADQTALDQEFQARFHSVPRPAPVAPVAPFVAPSFVF
eukprot:TRINITY_DN98223_c0_g1_i1.p1 TRINITY_DN98223_c0_g1~~TRINITY_DN98223_c0_g1_i1.p1  ORF type:complete len:173 (-),score=45.55 TRINITY_DN98223_c0_g1_i1:30-548(-)